MGKLPHERQTPLDLAKNSQVFEINGKIDDFKRLSEIVAANLAALEADRIPQNWRDRAVTGELRFGFIGAQDRVPAMAGHLAAQIDAVCQRCLEPFVLPLQTELQLVFGGEPGMENNGEEYEIWELDGDKLDVAELVEEALIMTIPFVTMHEGDASCSAKAAAGEEKVKTTLPFADLKAQMQRKD